MLNKSLRVLIVGDNASNHFGGEAILPLHYFRLLNQMGIEAHLLTHERVKASLLKQADLPHDKIHYVRDGWLFKALNKFSKLLPDRVAWLLINSLMYLIHSIHQWGQIRRLVKASSINIIHQPIPVSPKLPSGVFGFGVPVIIGPMNGGMHFPPAFEYLAASGELFAFKLLRKLAVGLKWLIPGKRLASLLLVANARTKAQLSPAEQLKARVLPENGVLTVLEHEKNVRDSETINCLFVGRLVDWKAVDILIEAFSRVSRQDLTLTIVGQGAEAQRLKQLVEAKGLSNVKFTGFVPFEYISAYYDQADIFVLPSVRECGGAVVLEAMARGLPVIATEWGGPVEYVSPDSGVLISPKSKEHLIEGFKTQIMYLAERPLLRQKMGQAGIESIKKDYLWHDKVNKMIHLYKELLSAS